MVAGGISRNWLRKIPLPGRLKAFNDDDTSWLEHSSQLKYEKKFIDRAAEIFDSVPASRIALTDWNARRAPFPTLDTRRSSLRDDLFRYQEL